MTCEHCGKTLVRVVVEWEDASLSTAWRCDCPATEDDIATVELGRAVPATDSEEHCALDTRGWS
jgi:hypothetical protein